MGRVVLCYVSATSLAPTDEDTDSGPAPVVSADGLGRFRPKECAIDPQLQRSVLGTMGECVADALQRTSSPPEGGAHGTDVLERRAGVHAADSGCQWSSVEKQLLLALLLPMSLLLAMLLLLLQLLAVVLLLPAVLLLSPA